MTVPRIVALAQALAMIMILAPGPHASAPASTLALSAPPPTGDDTRLIFGAAGSGIGCEVGADRFRGPRSPGDPPWPPGAEPTPSPAPSSGPAASVSPEPATEAATAKLAADAPALFVAASGVRVAQADLTAEPSGDAAAASTIDPSASPEPPGDALPPASAPLATPVPVAEDAYVSGIDVSHHNGDIDYERIRDAGYEFAFLKATQDNDFIDPMFATNLARARAAGLAAGGYHFFDYTLDGTVQADHFLDRLEATGGLVDALPPVVDVECWAPIGASIHAVSAARLRDFVERVYERTGRLPIVYTSVLMWKEVVGNAEGFEQLPLWAACWDCQAPPSIAPGWDAWTFWQTGLDRIRGVGSLDGNVFSGSSEDLDALRLRPLAIEAGAAATGRQQVALDLGGRSGTHLRTSSDGRTWSRWSPIRGAPRAMLGPEEGTQTLHVQLRNGPKVKSPVFSDSITLDTSGPRIGQPTADLSLAPLEGEDGTSGVPIEVTWEASDDVAGLADGSLSVACGGERATSTDAPGSAQPGVVTAWSAAGRLAPDTRCQVTIISRDAAGNATRTRVGTLVATLFPASGEGQPGGSVDGEQVGVIARRGPDMGRAAVLVDGQAEGLVDLYAPEPGGPEIVHVADLPSGAAVIAIEATGTSDAAATGTGIAIEGFVTLTSG
jgi:GH25 family lysozyme M1 (1,4-beta-N-acetylmuramidase)